MQAGIAAVITLILVSIYIGVGYMTSAKTTLDLAISSTAVAANQSAFLPNAEESAAVRQATIKFEHSLAVILSLVALAIVLLITIILLLRRKFSRQLHELEQLTFHDELTGLPNRMLFLDRLGQAIVRAQRAHGAFTLILLDLDRFKEVNDSLGHNVGDQLLQEVSCRISKAVRDTDTVARFGGDEFVVLLENVEADDVPDVAAKLHKALDRPFVFATQMIDVSASLGVVTYPAHGDDSVNLLKRAEVAMYSAKRNHSGFETFSDLHEKSQRTDLNFKSEMLKAIEKNELLLYFQPKIDLNNGRISSVEALVRWQHPVRGFLPPDMFIPLAEQTGLIDKLTFWVLKQALAQSNEFGKAGLMLPIAINLSARSLSDLRLPGEVASMLGKARVKSSALVFEITESAVMADPAEAMNVLKILDKMGVSLSIDDFGTGYSSLAYLSKLPVDEIKIDKSFVFDMLKDKQAAVIVRSTIELGHNLGLKVVAEGVENLETWNLLKELDCDTAQGYYMGKPMAAVDRKSTRLNSSHLEQSRIPSSA